MERSIRIGDIYKSIAPVQYIRIDNIDPFMGRWLFSDLTEHSDGYTEISINGFDFDRWELVGNFSKSQNLVNLYTILND